MKPDIRPPIKFIHFARGAPHGRYEGVVGYGIVYGCGVDRLRESLEEVRVNGVSSPYGLYVPVLVLRFNVIVCVAEDGVGP